MRLKGCDAVMEKLFSPSIYESKLCDPEDGALVVAAVILHSIGWKTQQGMPEGGIETLREMLRQDPETVVKACASTVEVLRQRAGGTFP